MCWGKRKGTLKSHGPKESWPKESWSRGLFSRIRTSLFHKDWIVHDGTSGFFFYSLGGMSGNWDES